MRIVFTEAGTIAPSNVAAQILLHHCMQHGLHIEYVPYSSIRKMSPDVLLISVHHALQFFNLPVLFSRAGIEMFRERRGQRPLVIIGGGAVHTNPQPVSDFADLVCIGEGEKWLPAVLLLIERGVPLVDIAEQVEGTWLPEWGTGRIVKRIRTALENNPPTLQFIDVKGVNNVVYIEAARGCKYRCRFCKIGWTVGYRELSRCFVEQKLADAALMFPNYHRVAMMAPNTGGLSWSESLGEMLDRYGFNMPYFSTRFDVPLIKMSHRNALFRFGLEGMSERLRNMVGKPIPDDMVVERMEQLFKVMGHPSAKWFIITGLPGESDEDWEAFGRLLLRLRYSHPKWGILRISATQFVPEPYTPMQWFPAGCDPQTPERLENVRQVIRSIKRSERTFGIRPIERPLGSARHALNVIGTRGDARVGRLIVALHQAGAQRCSSDRMMSIIEREAERCGLSLNWILGEFTPGGEVPWGRFIDCGVSESTLVEEYRAARRVIDNGRSAV